MGQSRTLVSGTKTDLPYAKYFELTALDGGATITSIELTCTCESGYDSEYLNGTYTGVGNDSYIYKLTVNNETFTIESLNKASNVSLNGSIAMTSASQATCTFALGTYTLNVSNDYCDLTYASKTVAALPEINFNRVYKVEDFESYTTTGTGYVNAAAKYTTSGLRANFYADYYTGSSSGEIGGNGWPVMTSTDNSTYTSNKGRNGTKGGIFKFSNGTGMRYISMNELYGVRSIIGKGSKLSIWARGAYTNTSFNVNHASNIPMKLYAFYSTPLTPSNQTTVRETLEFTVNAGSTWQHFELSLTPGRNYYGFGINSQQSSGSVAYVPIDDIEIYTASPYAEYVAPVAVTGVTLSPDSLDLTTGGTGELTATIAPANATNKAVTWESSNTSVATVDGGVVTAVSAGEATITVTTADGGFTDTATITVTDPVINFPAGTYKGTATVMGNDCDIVLAIGNQGSGLVSVMLLNKDASATGITYNSGTKAISITTTGKYSGMEYGTITGTYDTENNRITNISCSGSIKNYVSNNGSITATAATGTFYNCDGNTASLQATFKRRYMSGSWQVDTSNADRITSNTTEYVCGTGAVKRRGYGSGAVALNLNSDLSLAKTLSNIHFWVYNPSGSDIVLRMWVYKANNFGSNDEIGSVTAKANGWTYLAMGFTSAAIYNFQIADFNNTGTYLTFDNIYLF